MFFWVILVLKNFDIFEGYFLRFYTIVSYAIYRLPILSFAIVVIVFALFAFFQVVVVGVVTSFATLTTIRA